MRLAVHSAEARQHEELATVLVERPLHGDLVRAKYLRAHRDDLDTTGVFARVDVATEHDRVVLAASSQTRDDARARSAAFLSALCARHGCTNADVAVALDIQRERVRRMRLGEVPLSVGQVELLVLRVPQLADVVAAVLAARLPELEAAFTRRTR